jgi:hypothetical protein
MNQDLRKCAITITCNIANVCSALEHIKDGRLERATQLLESTLDLSVVCVDGLQKNGQELDRQTLITALKGARTYWGRHPRKMSGNLHAKQASQIEEVTQILQGIGDQS